MKIRITDKEIIKMDAAIKNLVMKCGDFRNQEALLARIIWNICFNPKEKSRSSKLLDALVNGSELKDLPACKGSLPIIK